MKRLWSIALILGLCLSSKHSSAMETSALESQVRELTLAVNQLKLTVERQEAEIAALKAAQPVLQPDPAPVISSASFTPAQTKWAPEIGVVGDVVFSQDSPKEDVEGSDRVSVREVELVFGSAVDPYSRFDATLGISDFEDMQIEEAYLTRFELPLEFTARIGRFLPRIGKAIAVHRDTLDTVDEPMVIEKYFGHHGFSKTGVDINRPIDLPWPVAHQVTLGVLEGGNGEEGTLFGESRRRPTIYSHLKNYVDVTDVTGLELGLSHLLGSRDEDSNFEVNVVGIDTTLIHRYGDRRHVKLQAESFYVSRQESAYDREDEDTGEVFFEDLDDAGSLWGGYFLADWRFHPQWATGFRFDDVQLIETDEDLAHPEANQKGYTGYLTFYQSEFARWRVQYSHIDTTDRIDDNRIYLQGTFAIGEHKHKIT